MTASRASSLPPGVSPRGLARAAAAAYVGVGATKFDEMTRDGRMPRAKRIDGRLVWDIKALDAAFEALPDDGEAEAERNEWDEIAA